MIAKRITIARQEKREIIHKHEMPKLSNTALEKVSLNYLMYSDLTGLDLKSKFKVNIIYIDL